MCPEGWRLFTWGDYEIIRDYNDKYGDGIKGLRSQCFHGNNASGFSLIGTGRRTIDGEFDGLNESVYWVYPQEHEYDVAEYANAAYVMSSVNDNTGTAKNRRAEKLGGRPVRCTKIE
ncbi:FISUMP domain-containing protein [Fibrobacter sp. UBA4297]|uniref:FISUMP domain-containing protein n=1 Tax=Fibrobacter sp. UBA4297 TaxID=1946536 RepID=UPI0025BF1C0D|nr:FISUMP domain-containing protein [Fibrobacter sp. UBA4297]